MRKYKLTMHQEYLDFLEQFGGPAKVADTMVELVYIGLIEPEQMTQAPPLDNSCIKRTLLLQNQHIDELIAIYGTSSPSVSIRRYLYYFVDNELYATYPDYFKFNTTPTVDKTKTVTLANLLRRKQ